MGAVRREAWIVIAELSCMIEVVDVLRGERGMS